MGGICIDIAGGFKGRNEAISLSDRVDKLENFQLFLIELELEL